MIGRMGTGNTAAVSSAQVLRYGQPTLISRKEVGLTRRVILRVLPEY